MMTLILLAGAALASPSADLAACAASSNDPAASYVVESDDSTLYAGPDLAAMLGATQDALDHDMDTAALVVNAEGREALIAFHACTLDADLIAGPVVWANTLGGVQLYEHDMQDPDGTTWTLAAWYYVDGIPVLSYAMDDSTPTCTRRHMPAWTTDDGVVILGAKSLVGWDPIYGAPPIYECEGRSACDTAECRMQSVGGPDNPRHGPGWVWYCQCEGSAILGPLEAAASCDIHVDPNKTGKAWEDGDDDGIGDGGIW